MDRWFGNTVYHKFTFLSTSHIVMLCIYLIGIILLFTFSPRLRQQSRLYKGISWTFIVILFLSEVTYQTWAVVNGVWSLKDHIPLHLCGIASIIALIALITKNERLIEISYFIGIVPAFLAIITPELPNDFPHYRFFKFFVHHISISWASIFLIITQPVTLTFKSVLRVFGILNVYAFIIYLINSLIGSNYLYLANTPTATTPLSFLGEGIWYIINLELVALSLFSCLYLLYKGFSKSKRTTPETDIVA